jgi:hypothetical protein
MTDPVRQLLMGPPLELTLYPPSSRYYGLATVEVLREDGRAVRYLRRRFLPDPASLVPLGEHRVADGDRLDNLATQYLGDPLQAWRIGDSNLTLRLEALVAETGGRIRLTLPAGVGVGVQGGPSNA